MDTEPDVTLIVPTMPGREALLRRALSSAEAQELPFADVLVHEDRAGRGAAHARNHLLRQVRTEYTAALDDDDYLLPGHNRVLRQMLEDNPTAGLAYSSGDFRNGDKLSPFTWRVTYGGQPVAAHSVPFREVSGQLRMFNWIPVTVMYRTEDALRAGGYNNVYSEVDEDWSFLVCLRDYGVEFVNTPEKTWVYDVTGRSRYGR